MSIKETVSFDTTDKLVPVGKIKLELFNADTGAKEYEHEKNNYINQSLIDIYMEASFFSRIDNVSGISSRSFANTLFLTDNSKPTHPETEAIIRGRIIGKGGIGVTSNNSMWGTYNNSESYSSVENLKIVIDYPTSSANGTFQSIYTSPTYSFDTSANHDLPSYRERLINVYNPMSYNYVAVGHGGYVWYLSTTGKLIKGYSKMKTAERNVGTYVFDSSDTVEINIANSNYPSITVVAMTVHHKQMWLMDNANRVYSLNLDNPNVLTMIKQLDTSVSRAKAFAYLSTRNQFVVEHSYRKLSITDDKFNLIKVIDLLESDIGENFYGFMLNPVLFEDGLVAYGEGYFDIDNIKSSNKADDQAGIRLPVSRDFMLGYTSRYTGKSDTFGFLGSMFTSRVLLDSPVTKTSTQTMKITYEFIFPKYRTPVFY